MRVLGVDPGTWKTGIGVIDLEKGKYRLVHFETLTLQTPALKGRVPLAKRLKKIHGNLTEVLKIFKPEVMALENVFYGLSFSAAVRIGEARAIAILAATDFNVDIMEYSPAEVKNAVTGNGRASKVQMQFMVRHLLGLRENPPQDSADALALAICHCHLMGKRDAFDRKKTASPLLSGSGSRPVTGVKYV